MGHEFLDGVDVTQTYDAYDSPYNLGDRARVDGKEYSYKYYSGTATAVSGTVVFNRLSAATYPHYVMDDYSESTKTVAGIVDGISVSRQKYAWFMTKGYASNVRKGISGTGRYISATALIFGAGDGIITGISAAGTMLGTYNPIGRCLVAVDSDTSTLTADLFISNR